MGGKSYFCDYCCCYMKNDLKVRRTHNEGLAHNIMKTTAMRRFEDPRKIYEQEIKKEPCLRYFKGYCKYDLYCQYTHFNEKQLKQLKELIENLNRRAKSGQWATGITTEKHKHIRKLSWANNLSKKNFKQLPKKLPPSLIPLRLSKLSKLNASYNKWG